jgi:hypothetical protein
LGDYVAAMTLRSVVAVVAGAVLCGCEPKFSDVTLTGLPSCPGSTLSAELVVKIEGPRVSLMQRVNGSQASIPGKLQQGKQYAVKAYFCKAEPCEVPGQLISESTITAPEAASGTVPLGIKNLPDCAAVAPPTPPAPAEPAAAPDAGPAAPAP